MATSSIQDLTDRPQAGFRGIVAAGIGLYVVLGVFSLARLIPGPSEPISEPWGWLDMAYGWWVASSFVLLQIGVGHRLISWLPGKALKGTGLARGLVAFTVGFWVTAVVFMAFASLGGLHPTAMVGYSVVALAIGVWPLSDGGRRLKRLVVVYRSPGGLVSGLFLAAAILVVFLPIFARSLLPNSDWDSASTHLPLAGWFLIHGLAPIPLALSNMVIPGTIHLVYSAFLALGAEQAIIPLNLLLSVMTCLAAAAIGQRFWGGNAGWWTFGACLSVSILLELGLDARIDGFLAFFCTIGALALMAWLLEDRQPGALVVSSMALGLALGTKYTALFPIALWSLPVLWVLIRRPETRQGNRGVAVMIAILCLLVPSGFWYLSNLFRYGDLVYPLLGSEILRLQDGTTIAEKEAIGSLMARAKEAGAVPTVPDSAFVTRPPYAPPRTLFDPVSIFTHPDRHARKPAHTVSPLLVLFFVLPLFRRDRASWLLFAMGLSVFLAVGSQTFLLRYGILVFPLLAAGAGVVLAKPESGWWRRAAAVALAAVLTWNLWVQWRILPDFRPGSWLTGREHRLEWLSEVGYNGRTEMPRAVRDIHSLRASGQVTREGKVLMIGEAKGWLLGMESIPDITRTARPWLARLARNEGNLNAVHQDLWNEGVRYVLVNLGYFQWVRETMVVDIDELIFSLHSIEQFNRARGEIIPLSDENMILVRIHPPTGSRG